MTDNTKDTDLDKEKNVTDTQKLPKTTIRVSHNKENPYVMINKTALRHPELSLKARGLWAYLLSFPDNWEFNIAHLVKSLPEGRIAINGAFEELIKFGYLIRLQYHGSKANGTFGFQKVQYIVFEFPLSESEKEDVYQTFEKNCIHSGKTKAKTEEIQNNFVQSGFVQTQNVQSQNMQLLSNEDSSYEESKTKKGKSTSADAERLSHFFLNLILKKKSNFSDSTTSWAKEFDALLKIRTYQEICDVCEFMVNSDFWWNKAGITSPKKLKEKLTTLEIQMNAAKEAAKPKAEVSNQEWSKKLEKAIDNPKIFEVLTKHVEVNRGAFCLDYISKGFKDQVESYIRKCNFALPKDLFNGI